jgi:hypothetical protein
MSRARIVWALGVVVAALALIAAILVATALPFGYDFRAYWLAARHLLDGALLYPEIGARLGQPDEFHYLPIVAVPFAVLLPLPIEVAARVWLVLELALATVFGVKLVLRLPPVARPWAAAAYVFFLPLVLEVTLGNVDLLCVALALVAWNWRARPNAAFAPYAAAIGIKFLPVVLLPFYLAAGYSRIVWRAFLLGATALMLTLPFLGTPMADFWALLPRYLDTEWVRIHAEREQPAFLATIAWSDAFPLVLALLAVSAGIVFGRNARADPARETEWHDMALAISPYGTPFGFIWTTFLIASIPLFVVTLRKALRLEGTERVVAIVGLLACWWAMQIVEVHDLMPIVAHMIGVLGLVAIALVLMALERDQTLGRSIPARRATPVASG